jgi:hypothetical protein
MAAGRADNSLLRNSFRFSIGLGKNIFREMIGLTAGPRAAFYRNTMADSWVLKHLK